MASEEANNLRLRRAITFLKAEGGDEPLDEYKEHVNLIEERICRGFLEGGYRFDYDLWRKVKKLVRQQMRNIELLEAAEFGGSSLESDLDDDDDDSVEELFREAADVGLDPPGDGHHHQPTPTTGTTRLRASAPEFISRSPGAARATVPATAATGVEPAPLVGGDHHHHRPRPRTVAQGAVPPSSTDDDTTSQQRPQPHLPDEHVREHRWLYGGPHNDFETWMKDLPSILPFGETFHMQEWESRKIQYDLDQSALRGPHDEFAVQTNVPYNSITVAKGVNPYDSGSRFKLPALPKDAQKWGAWFDHLQDVSLLTKAITDFNNGGCAKAQVDKDYAPRIFLDHINLNVVGPTPIRKAPGPKKPSRGKAAVRPLSHVQGGRAAGKQPVVASGSKQATTRKRKASGDGNTDAGEGPSTKRKPNKPKKAVTFLRADDSDDELAPRVLPKRVGRSAAGHEKVTRSSLRSGHTFRK